MTQVTIDSPDIKLTDGIKKAVEKVGAKVGKYMDGISLDCVIRKEAKDEVHILMKFKPSHGPEIQAEARHFDFYHGLGVAQKRMIRQVGDLKGKRESQKKHPPANTRDMAESDSEAKAQSAVTEGEAA